MEDIIKRMQVKGVIIYGAGGTGKQMIREMQINAIPVLSVWDQNAAYMSNIDQISIPDYQYPDKEVFVV